MNSDTVLHRHPIRGALWGLLMGLGGILLLMVLSIVRLDIPTAIIYTVAGAAFGILWGLFAPAKKPKGPAPVRAGAAPAAPAAPATPATPAEPARPATAAMPEEPPVEEEGDE